ncbi:hypothetical protein [Clostridium perfringens]|uniref:Uncharacterized protein n=1 Tax=Clostridium perfringens E str. JGS1987 TaxID=451755 RepID=B1BTE1_CLOPF|nr:hypothetical protein [Clostridium perfringens]EDT15032.1 hypothetical protein AC3_0058 [Clostridium perfringens E str. JGS1987]HBI7045664.1 hypothetical protein [Clostridium perfringens]
MEKYKEIQEVKEIFDILEKIKKININSKNYEDEINEISNSLINYYNNKGRHLYSEVSAFLFKVEDEDYEYIFENVKKVHKNLLHYDFENNSDYADKVLKLEDHIKLEWIRFERLKEVQEKNGIELSNKIKEETRKLKEEADKFEVESKKHKGKIKNLNKSYKKMKDNIDGLNSQIISVIGIFSAIVITFFGGINFLESVLNSIGKVSKYRFVLGAFIVGFVMFNTIFMLLNFISKLTEKNIRSECRYYKNGYCDSECKIRGKIKCVKEKHPTIYWVNICFILGIISIVIIYYIDYYNIISHIFF